MTESEHQIALFKWAEYSKGKYPELELLHHIPNGGKRSALTATILKREGVKAGVPDLFLPVARGGYHGLYIEMKKEGGRLSKNQKRWIKELIKQGYRAAVCFGFEPARKELLNYLKTEKNNSLDIQETKNKLQ